MDAIVLAGGFGTRLAHMVPNLPKPMAKVDGIPFLKYIIDDLIHKGITKIVVAVGYQKEVIINYFQNSYRGIPIIYSIEDTPLLTGGAIKRGLTYCTEENIFVINGDTYFDISHKSMLDFHLNSAADITVAVKLMQNFDRYGHIEFESNKRIFKFNEKGFCSEGYINGGIYLIKRNTLKNFEEIAFSFEKEVMEKEVLDKKTFAFEAYGYFIDIGIPSDYIQAQTDFKNKIHFKPAAFFDRDGTINVNFGHVYRIEDLELVPGISDIIKSYNQQGWPVIVISNQAGIAKGFYSEDEMHLFNTYLNSLLREKYSAHFDAFYFCPHHPDITGSCNCRKPEPGLILRAARELDIDLSKSVFYGDKETDRKAAISAGIPRFIPVGNEMKML